MIMFAEWLIALVGTLATVFTTVYLCLYRGILDVVDGFSVDPPKSADIAVGALKVLIAMPVGYLMVFLTVGAIMVVRRARKN
jgi:hypothetical protein